MADEKHVTTSQLRNDLSPAASPLGTDDEAGDTTPSADRVEMARRADERIDAAAKRTVDEQDAHAQRGSSTGYGKEEHMNKELAKQKEQERGEGDPSEQPS